MTSYYKECNPFYLSNPSSGKVLCVRGNDCEKAPIFVDIQDRALDAQQSQKFTLTDDGRLENRQCSGRYLSNQYDTCANGNKLVLKPAISAELWTFYEHGRIINKRCKSFLLLLFPWLVCFCCFYLNKLASFFFTKSGGQWKGDLAVSIIEDNSITKNDHIETIPVTFINPESNLALSVGSCGHGINVALASKEVDDSDAQVYYLKRTMKNLWEIHSKKCPHYLVQLDGDCRLGEKVQLGWAVQKVKVQLEGTNIMQLAEVEVFDYADNNVALSKQATQSSIYPGEYPATRSVDGNVNTFSHTKSDQSKYTFIETTL